MTLADVNQTMIYFKNNLLSEKQQELLLKDNYSIITLAGCDLRNNVNMVKNTTFHKHVKFSN